MTADRLLREDELPVGDHVELALVSRKVGRVVALCPELGRETRGPFVVRASDGAVVDLDLHADESRVSGRISAIERQPARPIVRSRSAAKFFSTVRTPCSPASASP